jgi:chromosome segregation ATPase
MKRSKAGAAPSGVGRDRDKGSFFSPRPPVAASMVEKGSKGKSTGEKGKAPAAPVPASAAAAAPSASAAKLLGDHGGPRSIGDPCDPAEEARLERMRVAALEALASLSLEDKEGAAAVRLSVETAEAAAKRAETLGYQAAAVDLAVAHSAYSQAAGDRLALESRCRSLQARNKALAQDVATRGVRDSAARADLETEFTASLQSIRDQLEEQMKRCDQQKAENDELSSKLEAFKGTLTLREDHWAASCRASALEVQLWEGKVGIVEQDLELLRRKLAALEEKEQEKADQTTKIAEDVEAVIQQMKSTGELVEEGKKRLVEDEPIILKAAENVKRLEADNLVLKRSVAEHQLALVGELEATKKLGGDLESTQKVVRKLRSLCSILKAQGQP